MPGFNGVGWFEIGTDDPAAARQFYGDVLGWTVADSPGTYQMVTTGDAGGPHGGLFATEGKMPNYAIFTVLVQDVDDICRRTEQAGGKVQRPKQVTPDGLAFAYLLDPAGNQFGVFAPPVNSA